MSAAVRIDAKAFTDIRFKVLGMMLGVPEVYAHSVGLERCAKLWAHQTKVYRPDAPSYVQPIAVIEAFLGNGGAQWLVLADLAEAVEGGGALRIKGTEGRIEWLYKLTLKSSAGGKGRAKQRAASKPRRVPQAKPQAQPQAEATAEPQVQPQLSPLISSLSPLPDPDPISTPEIKEKLCHGEPEELSSDQRSTPPSDHQAFVAEFTELYHERTGEKPTWDGKRGKLVKQLLGQHGLATCILRARKLFREQPGYIVGTPDLGTLVAFFDRLAGQHLNVVGSQRAPPRGSGPTVSELNARAKWLEENGR